MKKQILYQTFFVLCFSLILSENAFTQETYTTGAKVVVQNYGDQKWYNGDYTSGSNNNHAASYIFEGNKISLTGLYDIEIMPTSEADQKNIVRANGQSAAPPSKSGSGSQAPKISRIVGSGSAPQLSSPSSINMASLENEIVIEVNKMRANPKGYANELAQLKFINSSANSIAIFVGNDRLWSCSKNDVACMEDYLNKIQGAINALYGVSDSKYPVTQTSLSQLTRMSVLDQASQMLAADQGQINGSAHKDSQGRGAFCRAKTAGYSFRIGECLNSNNLTAKAYVIGFLTSPEHRKILTEPSYDQIGVDTHYHSKDNYIRNVIMCGDKDANMMADPCGNNW